jgi:hypothetical protein
MAKLLVGITSCDRFEENGWNDSLRETWLKDAGDLGVDYKFFIGNHLGTNTITSDRSDAITVDADDGYDGITVKAKRKYQYAVDREYDFMFHCYHDTYACVERLVALCDGHADYIGDYLHTDVRQPYPHDSYGRHCQGGPGYIISRKAFTYCADEFPEAGDPRYHNSEDTWTGVVVRAHEDLKIEDSRAFWNSLEADDAGPQRNNGIVSNHLSTVRPIGQWDGTGRQEEFKYRPEYMYKLHREWKASCQ